MKQYNDDFKQKLDEEVKNINKQYKDEQTLEQSGIPSQIVDAIDIQQLKDGRFSRYISGPSEFVICLISNDKNDYIVDNIIFNKCKIYIPQYSILEGELAHFPSKLYNYDRQPYKEFINQFGENMIEPLYCYAYLFAFNQEQLDFLYKELLNHIKDNKVPGVLEEDYYMIDLNELESWCYNNFYNNWQNRNRTTF